MAAPKKSAQSKSKKTSTVSKSRRSSSTAAKRAAWDYERRVELQVMAFASLSIIFLIIAIVRYL